MHRYLLLEAFKKAKKEKGSYTWRQAKHISNYILDSSDQPYGEKILSINYKKAKKNPPERIELKPFVEQSLCEYLGCEDFKDFKEKYPIENTHQKPKSIWELSIRITKKYGAYILLFLAISGFIIMFSLDKPKWMAWQEDHYVEVSFDTDKYKVSELKLYDEDRILYFKKITPDCETEFFKPNGLENLWYGKSAQGELEYFTALGKHPETGKTLKPITAYMIKKYICEGYK